MIPLPGGSSPFLFLLSKLRHPASQPVHSPPPTTPPAVVQTGRPNRGHTTANRGHTAAFVSREDAKARRETQWSSARGTSRPEMGRRWGHTTRRPEQHLRQAHPGTTAGAGDTPLPERGTHHFSDGDGRSRGHTTAFVSREDAKTRKETQWSSSRRTNPAGDGPERRGAGTHHTSIAASHTILPKHTILPAYTIQPLHNTLEPAETI